MDKKEDFMVKCAVCGQTYINHVGSTECCGSIAYLVEDGVETKTFIMYALKDGKHITTLK